MKSKYMCDEKRKNKSELTMIKLLNQLEQVDRATPLARREDGKISEKNFCG
jgi:hypothetical protein